jgi:NAD(P)-dependent dehydrogenase (short-subunit alcohol dehydrogenase family)
MKRNATVIVTGAAGNLGRAVVEAFEAQDARLVLIDLQAHALEAAFGQPGPQRLFAPCNLLDEGQVKRAVDLAAEHFGGIDVLCNLAGGFRMGEAVHEAQQESWDQMIDLNLQTVLNMCRAVVPSMLRRGEGGRIVNVAAYSARQGLARMGPYCASKGAVIHLTESMSAELRDQGINVNCVLPGVLDTPENRAAMPDADPGRWVAPRDLAQVIAFLASEHARAVHGAAVPVTGLG